MPRSWLLAAFAIYTAITLAAALAGVSSQRSIWSTYERMQGFMAVAHWFVYAWILVSVYRTRADWRAVLNLGLGVGVVLAMVGLAQSEGIELAPYIQAQRRVYSLLGNPTYVGSYMLICIMVAGAFLAHSYCNSPVESVPRPQPRERQQLGGRRRRRARERQALPTLSPPAWAGAWLSAIGLAGLLAVIFGTTLLFWLMVLVLLGFGASYYLQGSRRGCWWRVFWMVSIALSLYLIALSGTRGAAVGLIGALALSAFVYALIGKVRVGRLACAGALAFLLIAPLVVYAARNTPPVEAVRDRSTIVDRLLRIGPDDRSVQGRTSSALTGLRAYADRPILGWGPENYTIAYDRHVSAETASSVSESFDQAHNKLIEELTTKGLLGFASYSMIWVLMAAILYLRAKGQTAARAAADGAPWRGRRSVLHPEPLPVRHAGDRCLVPAAVRLRGLPGDDAGSWDHGRRTAGSGNASAEAACPCSQRVPLRQRLWDRGRGHPCRRWPRRVLPRRPALRRRQGNVRRARLRDARTGEGRGLRACR